ncbi:MAG: hypothetical protein BWY09_03209 [Candidatus Hydrogenedentes bacterium ADurb.Bin179]|nr:MAG: hypothetical protein BWY09_03209 [Candidatus Hydrogenedentes bacterium ADurb.Bin179]
MANTMKFFDKILTAFFARQNPVSTRANPAFMKNTRNPASMTHSVSSITRVSANAEAASSARAKGVTQQSPASMAAKRKSPLRRMLVLISCCMFIL